MRNPIEDQNYLYIRSKGSRVRHARNKHYGGRLVLHKRKPLRDPAVAAHMAEIRAHVNPNKTKI